jgi:hypothetical protein
LIFMSDIAWYGLFPLFGQLFRFSFVNTDCNCSFNIYALLLLSLFRNSILFFNGATPVHYWPLLLINDQNFGDFSL